MKAKVWAALAAVGALLSFLAVELAQHFGFIAGEKIHEKLTGSDVETRYQKTADDLNKNVPMAADANTRLDNVAFADMTITYNYTILEAPPASEIEALGAGITANAKQNYCGPSVNFRNDGVAVAMRYVDTSGNFLYALRVTPQDC